MRIESLVAGIAISSNVTTVCELAEPPKKATATENPETSRNHRIFMANSLRFDGRHATRSRDAKREHSGLGGGPSPPASRRRFLLPPLPSIDFNKMSV